MKVSVFIADAMRELNIIGAADVPEAEEAALGLRLFQGMVDQFQADRRLLYTTLRQSYPLVSGQVTRTIGAAGNFVGNPPIWISDAASVIPVGETQEIPVGVYRVKDEYLREPLKTLTALYPERVFYERTSALLGTFTFWPIPTTAAAFIFGSPVPLTTPATADTDLTFPAGGYLEAWRLNLEQRFVRPFAVPASLAAGLREDARDALKMIARMNDPGPPPLRIDPALTGAGAYDVTTNRYR